MNGSRRGRPVAHVAAEMGISRTRPTSGSGGSPRRASPACIVSTPSRPKTTPHRTPAGTEVRVCRLPQDVSSAATAEYGQPGSSSARPVPGSRHGGRNGPGRLRRPAETTVRRPPPGPAGHPPLAVCPVPCALCPVTMQRIRRRSASRPLFRRRLPACRPAGGLLRRAPGSSPALPFARHSCVIQRSWHQRAGRCRHLTSQQRHKEFEMLRKRLHLIAVPVAAITLPLTVAGFQADAAAAPAPARHGPARSPRRRPRAWPMPRRWSATSTATATRTRSATPASPAPG